MNDDHIVEPAITPTFAPKHGLTKEEQRKVNAYIKKHGVTPCPAVGSPELVALGLKKYRKWLASIGMAMKVKLGLAPVKRPERTEKEKIEHRKKREREWHRKKKEEKRK